jgi:hypothetical protein
MPSREISMMTPLMVSLYYKFEAAMQQAGVPFLVTCTARTYQEQVALYAQGRQMIDEVNYLRKAAGLPPITLNENKKKVTWTLASKHIINLQDGDPRNDLSRAFDIVILKDGKAIWDVKADINKNNIPDYKEAGSIGKSVGLIWGGDFYTPDYPHFQEPNVKL